jgi:hypothetical protein
MGLFSTNKKKMTRVTSSGNTYSEDDLQFIHLRACNSLGTSNMDDFIEIFAPHVSSAVKTILVLNEALPVLLKRQLDQNDMLQKIIDQNDMLQKRCDMLLADNQNLRTQLSQNNTSALIR